jgi:general secretion pathway protein D
MARVLTDMFGGGSSSSLLDSADNQIAPGSGSSASAADHLSLNNNNGSNGTGNGPVSSAGSFGSRPGSTSGFGATAPGGAGANLGSLDKGSSSASGPPLLPGVRITADSVNNTLLIYADQGNYRTIESTLHQIDQPQLQVAIDATIAEVTLTDELQYGVQFFLTSHALGLRPDQGSLLNTTSTAGPASAVTAAATTTTTATAAATTTAAATGTVVNTFINRAFPGFNFLVGQEAQPAAILTALHTVTGVKVLSNPSLVVVNNQAATLQVGDQVPVSTGSATVLTTSNTVVNTVDYRNTGIILHVAPRINANGNVRLDIEQEISNVEPATATSLTPTISERKVKSSISVANGQTVLLAGLISDQKNENRSGIPLLDDLKGIGNAFSNQDNTKMRTELIIFIRPQIIRDSMDAHTVAEELRSKLRGTLNTSTANDSRVQNAH